LNPYVILLEGSNRPRNSSADHRILFTKCSVLDIN